MSNETIDTRSLRIAAGYIECVREILKEIHPIIPEDIKTKYKITKLESGLVDIQKP